MNHRDSSSFPSPPNGRQGWPWTGDDNTPLAPPAKDSAAPSVTVITPSFNQGPYLEEAVRSVILQNHPNLEYLVFDGGSTDESVAVLRKYEPWISSWVSEPDGGQAEAINRGFEQSTGKYLCWLNADDVLYQGFLSRRVAEFAIRPTTDLIYGDVDLGWDVSGKTLLRGEALSFTEMLRTLNVAVPQQSAMWRRATFERLGGLDPRWHVVLDREFFLRIFRSGTAEYIPGCCGFFRQHEGAKSVAETTVWVDELPMMYTEFFDQAELDQETRSLERETMASVHLMCSDILRAAHDWGGSLTSLGRAVGWNPRHAISNFLSARVRGLRRRLAAIAENTKP